MAENKALDPNVKNRLEELVLENTAPQIIADTISNEFSSKYSKKNIIGYTLEYFNKKWVPTICRYTSIPNDVITQMDIDVEKHTEKKATLESKSDNSNLQTDKVPGNNVGTEEEAKINDSQKPTSEEDIGIDEEPTPTDSIPVKDYTKVDTVEKLEPSGTIVNHSKSEKTKNKSDEKEAPQKINQGISSEESAEPAEVTDSQNPLSKPAPPTINENEGLSNSLQQVAEYLELLYKGVRHLEASNRNISTRLASLENQITEMQTNNPYEKVQKFADELIDIYANEKSKKSVNINPSINNRIIEAMHQKYGISNNNALAINTALLMALYKSGLDGLPEK